MQLQAPVADLRHQRQGRQRLQGHSWLTRINHSQAQARCFTLPFAARRHQQPFGVKPGGHEVLAAGQAQTLQARLHVRRAHATPLGGA
ncbi:hypothetical protein D3C76_1567590 [compost metagenome]